MTVRVRYAPSPTGDPHVGNIRTALFNWLFARHHGGCFIVRIEDTDQARQVPGALAAILDALRWLGLDWDEGPEVDGPYGPYLQSQRLQHYHRAAEQLLADGHAYRCYCSPDRLEQMRREQQARKKPPRYDRRCRNLGDGERRELEAQGLTPVVRFKTPLDGQTAFHDLIRGDITFDNAVLDDFVILKSDGFPTYHLANVVDDHPMRISHIMRADEWLPSTPRHVLLYDALGLEPPAFAHLPMIVGPDRAKLSKRHGAVALSEYHRQGFLPEALFNFLGLLGWSLDDRTEIISRQQFIESFGLERIGVAAAIFDLDKLTWVNGVYIRQLSLDDLTDRLIPFLERDLPPEVARPLDRDYLLHIAPLIQERIKRLDEAPALTDFFFLELTYDAATLLGKRFAQSPAEAQAALQAAHHRLSALVAWESEGLEGLLRPLAQDLGLKTGDLFGLLRVAVTGRTVSPPLFQTMAVLGRQHCLERLATARRRLQPA
ncbi:MAG: glutamate--tRNA ligase [Dehalococcoidia bacterium]